MGAAAFLALFALLLTSSNFPNQAYAQSSPSVDIRLSDTSVEQGTAITATMSFGNLESDSDTSTIDYIFRADVKDSDNGDADDCEGSGLGSGQDMAVVDEDPETRTGTISADCPAGAYTLRVSISSADKTELASASVAFTIAAPCSGNPNPVGVDVEAVPIVVESTTDDYFVLYVRHEVDGEAIELPVLVKLGGDGTTTLAENVAALPKERYRVEKYLVADPADVDGDCIDDITEIADPVGMNPVNPAPAIDISDGAVAVADRETFETLSLDVPFGLSYVKFVLFDMDTDRPRLYFQNSQTYPFHSVFLDAVGLDRYQDGLLRGTIAYVPELLASDGSAGVYYYRLNMGHQPFSHGERTYALIAASMPVLEDNLALHMPNYDLPNIQADLPLYRESRINLVFDEEILPETSFLVLNQGEGYGLLRVMDLDERPNPRDVVVYEALPNELPRVAGIVTTVPQTPLSHVNLRAVQDRVPNAFIRGALDDPAIETLLGSYVHYTVTKGLYSIRAATRAEVDAHYASSRPAAEQTPQRDLSVTEITALSDVEFEDWTAFGVKAANVAVLGTLDFPSGTVPDGFAVPFYFYDEFMKHNGFYADVATMLADPDFQTDFDTQESELKKLRKKIKKGETPDWITEALTEMHGEFPEGTSLRYRSSTNNEDLPGFNGAGLYDSKTQHPEETEEDGIAKSLKQVYASLWNFRAFIERDFHRIDHLAAAMGVLVHPNYSSELANGVAVSFDPAYGTDESYYVNTQVDEDLVTNPDAHSVPEEILLYPAYSYLYRVVATSNQVPPGQLIMSDDQLDQLQRHLTVIHEEFTELYGLGDGERFAMEIEFKITSENILAIKQARPWVFEGAATAAAPGDATLSGLTLSGVPFTFASDTASYVVNVANDMDETTVTATANDGGATYVVKLGGVTDEDSVVPLAVGSNVITIEVTAEDGKTAKTYTVTVTRAAPDATAPDAPDRPTGQSTGRGAVSLDWNEVLTATSYDVRIWQVDAYTELSADASVNGISITFNGSSATVSGLPTDYDWYYFQVSAVNNAGASGWSPNNAIEVTRAEPSSDAAVAIGLSPSGPVEEGTEITVTMSFGGLERDSNPNDVDYIFRADVVSRVDRNSADVCEGKGIGSNRNFNQVDEDPEVRTGTVSASCTPGDYSVEVSVSSPGNIELASATADFTVNTPGQQQPEPPSTDATLNGLALRGVYFGAFYPATTGYTASVANDVTQTTVTPTVNHDGATYAIKLGGVTDADGGIPLAVGSNVITIEVTAEDGNTVKTYTVTVNRAAPPPSTDATLSNLALSGVYFGTFYPATTGYTANVANGVDETTVTPTTNDGGASYVVKLGGVTDADSVVPLTVGGNVITVEVTAEDGNASKTYTVTVTRAAPTPSTDATLNGLALSGVYFGTFYPATTGYTASVANDVDETTVTPTTNDAGATYKVKLDGVADADGTVSLAVGSNVITIEVTAEDGNTAKTYSVTVTRATPTVSGPAVSIELSPSGPVEEGTEVTVTMSFGSLERDSDPNDVDYIFRADVKNSANGNTDSCEDQKGGYGLGVERYMKRVDEDPEVRAGTISASCAPGDYTVEVSISSPGNVELASATADFTVNASGQEQQPEPPSTDATLRGLALSDVALAFDSATTEYSASVANDVDETTVTPTVNDDGATYEVKLGGVADGDGTVSLAVGSNVITIEVTAQDGETANTYTVNVTRAEPLSTDATLSGLELSGIDFGAFNSATTGYTASVSNDVDETTVTPAMNHDGATHAIKLGGVAHADGIIPLAVGGNVITIEVTAEDGNSAKTYTVTVTRPEAPAPEPTVAIALSSDSVEEGTEVTVTMSFANLTPDNDANLVFRADVVGADSCEGQGIGVARNISKVDEDPEIRTGTISGDCPTGNYTMEVSLTDDDVELASARADFSVVEPDPTDEPAPTAPPEVPDKPTGEVVGKGQVRLDWNDVEGATYYQVRFYGNEGWVELPTDDIGLVLDGSGATASNLPDYGFYYFAVRAGNAAGVSEWSDFLTMPNPEQ